MPEILLPDGTSSGDMDPTMLIGTWADYLEGLRKSQGDNNDSPITSPPAVPTYAAPSGKSPFKKGRSSPAIPNSTVNRKLDFNLAESVSIADSKADSDTPEGSPSQFFEIVKAQQTTEALQQSKIIRAHMGKPTFPLSEKFTQAVKESLKNTRKDKQAIDYSHPQGALLAREVMANALNIWYGEEFAHKTTNNSNNSNVALSLSNTVDSLDEDYMSPPSSPKKTSGPFTPEDIIFTTGGANALNNIFKVLRDENPQGVILTPFPYYTLYRGEKRQNNLFPIPMEQENNYRLTAVALEAAVLAAKAAGHTISAITICDPANPLGTIIGYEEWIKLAKVIRKYNLRVVLDEAYAEMCLDGQQHVSLLHVAPDLKNNIVLLRSATKGFSAAGWRMAVTAIWDEKLRTKFVSTNIQSTGHAASNNSFLYANLMAEVTPADLKEIAEHYAPKVRYVSDRLKEMGLWINPHYQVEGTFYVCASIKELFGLPIPDGMKQSLGIKSSVITTDLEAAYYLMFQDNFTVNALSNFGIDPKKGWIRITCSGTEQQLKEMMNKLQARIEYARKEKIKKLTKLVRKKVSVIEKISLDLQPTTENSTNGSSATSDSELFVKHEAARKEILGIRQNYKLQLGMDIDEPTQFEIDEDISKYKNNFEDTKNEFRSYLRKLIPIVKNLLSNEYYKKYPAKRKSLWNFLSWFECADGSENEVKRDLKAKFAECLNYDENNTHLNILLSNFIEIAFSNKQGWLAKQLIVQLYPKFIEKINLLVQLHSLPNLTDDQISVRDDGIFNEIAALKTELDNMLAIKKINVLESTAEKLFELQVSLNPNAAQVINRTVRTLLYRQKLEDSLLNTKTKVEQKWSEWIGSLTAEEIVNNPVLKSIPHRNLETLPATVRVQCKDWLMFLGEKVGLFRQQVLPPIDRSANSSSQADTDTQSLFANEKMEIDGSPRKANGSEKKINNRSQPSTNQVSVNLFFDHLETGQNKATQNISKGEVDVKIASCHHSAVMTFTNEA